MLSTDQFHGRQRSLNNLNQKSQRNSTNDNVNDKDKNKSSNETSKTSRFKPKLLQTTDNIDSKPSKSVEDQPLNKSMNENLIKRLNSLEKKNAELKKEMELHQRKIDFLQKQMILFYQKIKTLEK